MELQQRIEQQFEKYPHLKVLFFFDPNQEMEEDVSQLVLQGIRVVKYARNPFNLKVKLHGLWSADKIFLYFPTAAPVTPEELKTFPLLDVLVANKELRLGDVNAFMEQYGLQAEHQSLVATYINELKYSGVQQVLKSLLNGSLTKNDLERGLISTFLKFNEPQPWEFLTAKLLIWSKAEYREDLVRLQKKLRETRLEELVTTRLSEQFDEPVTSLNREVLLHLTKKTKYNLMLLQMEPVQNDPYTALRIKHGTSLSKLGVSFEQIRVHPKLGSGFIEALLEQGEEIREEVILQHYGPTAVYYWMPDTLKWLVLNDYIIRLLEAPEKVLVALENMGLHQLENENLKIVLTACMHTAGCLKTIAEVSTYRLNKPEDYVQQYARSGYRIDQAYRKAIYKLSVVDASEVPDYVALHSLQEALNNRYELWLEMLNREWLGCLASTGFDYSKLSLSKQYDFYASEVAPFDQKVVVFISDALRFEAAVDLLHEMHNDRKSEAELRFMLASVPSKTSVGMSNLLPGKKRVFNNDDIYIDGARADSAVNRQTLLQAAQPTALVITYDQVERNTQEQNRELFKAPVVYIYHNVIDARGDNRLSERQTFKAVEDAIVEIRQLVKRIHGTYNVARVLITADHGFLYNDRMIADADKEDFPIQGAVVQHNRFGIYDKQVSPALGYCIPLKATTRFEDEQWVVFPASTNRYKRQGAGQQYVHGGASLQELIVPVIESARRREDISKKVSVKLLTMQPKIVSNILKVEILQENNVSRYEKGRTIKAGIYHGYDLVSTAQELVLDSASELASERLFTVTLTVTKQGNSSSALVFKIFDAEDTFNALIEKPVINNTLIQIDF